MVCEFIAGLPEHAEKLLQATTKVDDLPISEILAGAQAILKESFTGTGLAATVAQLPGCQEKETTALRRCYICQGPNHMARYCLRWCESLSLVIGASDRVTLPEIVQEMNKGTSLQHLSLPKTSSEQCAVCVHFAD